MTDWRSWSCHDVAEWLVKTGFPQYTETFKVNDIAGDILPELSNDVLRDDLGIAAFGHRTRILHAVRALMQSEQPTKKTLDLLVLHAAPLVIRSGEGLGAMEKLDLEAERQAITNALRHDMHHRAVHIRFDVATADVLRRLVTTTSFRALHFSGHGRGVDPAICFEDGYGCAHLVTPDHLRELTFTGRDSSDSMASTQLVFVNSCHSERVARVFVESGIPHVVAVHSDSLVVDASATMFAKHFYLSLFSGDTVQTAFDVARGLVRALPSPPRGVCCCAHLHEVTCDWVKAGSSHSHHIQGRCCCKGDSLRYPHDESSKFLLLGGDGSPHAHEIVLFENMASGRLHDHTPKCPSSIPSQHGQFIGRNREMHHLIKAIQSHAITVCIGAPGIGKSSMVVAVAHFAHSRRLFEDGVFHVDLEGQKLSSVRYAIAQAMGIAAGDSDDEVFAEIGTRRCLLVLDKMEELMDEDEEQTQNLLSKIVALSPNTRLLVASRRIPHVAGVSASSLSLTQLPMHMATHLLRLMAPTCSKNDAQRLAKICGGLPLAIRVVGRALANARSMLTPSQMIEHLESGESTLENMKEINQVGQRECIDRCIRSSFSHLDEPLRLAFMALGLFRGVFGREAVEALLPPPRSSSGSHLERSDSGSTVSSSGLSSGSFFPQAVYASRRFQSLDIDQETSSGLGDKLQELDGFLFENDGVFTRESYNLLNCESTDEVQAQTIEVASAEKALHQLHKWSLLEVDARAKRYRMHNLIQLFAEEEGVHIADPGDEERRHPLGRELLLTWRRRFVRHYCVVVANASHAYRYDGQLELFDRERANIDSAIRIAHMLTAQNIERMRDIRREESERQFDEALAGVSIQSEFGDEEDTNASRPKSPDVRLFEPSALLDALIYCNLVARSRFILRTRMEPKRRLRVFSSCLHLIRETRSLYCTCGCSENDPANLLWDIEEVKYDRPLGILDTLPTYDEPVAGKADAFPCSCHGLRELIALEILLLIDLGYAACDGADWIAGEYFYLEVIRLQRDVLGWGENAQVAEVMNQFGICLSSSAAWGFMAFNIWMLRHAERLLLAATKVRGRVLGERHPEFATSLNNLANFYKNSNPSKRQNPSQQRRPQRNDRSGRGRRSGDSASHDRDLRHTTSNGNHARRNTEVDATGTPDVETLYRRSLAIREATLGSCHPHVAQSLNNLALFLSHKLELGAFVDERHRSQMEEIDQLFNRALQIRSLTLGNASFETAATLNNIGNLKRLQRKWAEGEKRILEAIRVISRFDSEQSPRAARMYVNLGRLYRDQQRYDEAIAAYSTARDIRQKWFPDSRDVGYCIEQIGKCMLAQGKTEEGEVVTTRGRKMRKLGAMAIPDLTKDARGRSHAPDDSTPAHVSARVNVISVVPEEALWCRPFNFAGRLLGDRGVLMKRIDAISCAHLRYFGPWPSEIFKAGSTAETNKLVREAHVRITAVSDQALERARRECIYHLQDIRRQWTNYCEADAERRQSESMSHEDAMP
ncbi:hypothetical protein PINS_up005692 [Pythium insidiosum]|nr:hypothetical protein PINS_up005692 [Pythium insidiosum]